MMDENVAVQEETANQQEAETQREVEEQATSDENVSTMFSKMQELIGEGLDKMENVMFESGQWPKELVEVANKAKGEQELRMVFAGYNQFIGTRTSNEYTPAPVVLFSREQEGGCEVALMWEILAPSRPGQTRRQTVAQLKIEDKPGTDEKRGVTEGEETNGSPKPKFRDLTEEYNVTSETVLFQDYIAARDCANSLNAGRLYAEMNPKLEELKKTIFDTLAPNILKTFEIELVRTYQSLKRHGEGMPPFQALVSAVRKCVLDPASTAKQAEETLDKKIAAAESEEVRAKLIEMKEQRARKIAEEKSNSTFEIGMLEVLEEHRAKKASGVDPDDDEDEDDADDDGNGMTDSATTTAEKTIQEPAASQQS